MDRTYVDFRLAPDDISAIRFGISPGHELCHAIRVLQRPDDQPLQWGWLRSVRDQVPREAFELLAVIVGADGYFPDFLTATPSWDMGPDDEAVGGDPARPHGDVGSQEAFDLRPHRLEQRQSASGRPAASAR